MAEPVMEFHIVIQRGKISRLNSPSGKAVIIPFEGYVVSGLFTGRILPGAADVQTTNAAGIRHMCAKYMFEGTDEQGTFCHLFTENNGYFEKEPSGGVFHACPSFMSDSPVLNEKLSGPWFRAEGHPSEEGVIIKIFDIRLSEEEMKTVPPRKGSSFSLISGELQEGFASLSEDRKRQAEQTAEKIRSEGKIEKIVFYYEKDAGTYVYRGEEEDEPDLTLLLSALYDSAGLLFVMAGDKLCALYCAVGKIRDIPDDALMIFQQTLETQNGNAVFGRSLTSFRKIKVFG